MRSAPWGYKQLYEQIREAVQRGGLKKGGCEKLVGLEYKRRGSVEEWAGVGNNEELGTGT